MFLSAAFIDAVAAGQWLPLVTAALLSPALAWLVAAKPNYAILLLATVRSRQALVIAVVGGTLLLVISVGLAPHWPEQWLATLTTSGQFAQPILLSGRFLILLALLRWRRPEARLILALAIVPQTFYWYETLPLMLVPATLRQSLALSLVSSCGFLIERGLLMQRFGMTRQEDSALLIALVYLPCVLLVLQRRNEGELPFWVRPIVTRYRSWRNHPPGASNSPTG